MLTALTSTNIQNPVNEEVASYLEGKYRIEVIDLLVTLKLAEGDQIFAVPTLVEKNAGSNTKNHW